MAEINFFLEHYAFNRFFCLKVAGVVAPPASNILLLFLEREFVSLKKIKSNNIIFNNYKYTSFPSKEKKRIAGEKKVNEFKDGFLILLEMIRLFFIRK